MTFTIDPIKAAAPYMLAIKAVALLSVLAFASWHAYDFGRDRWQGKFDAEVSAHKATKAAHAAVLQDLTGKTKAAADAARRASNVAKTERATNDDRFKEAQHDAEQAKRALRDHLRAGTGPVRLRAEWTCPAAGPAQGGTAAAAGGQDAGADLRAAGAADLIAAADHADNWIGWLQAELIATRKACGVVP